MSQQTNPGYIKLFRSIENTFLYPSKREFTEFEAWIDIIMTVNFSDAKVKLGNEVFNCLRGQSLLSLDSWGQRWRWNKSKVRRFFELLKKESMITTENVQKTTRLTVCKYDHYQGSRNAGETQVKRTRNAGETHLTPIEEEERRIRRIKTINIKEAFEKVVKAYPGTKRKAETEWENLIKKHDDYQEVLSFMLDNLNRIKADREQKSKSGAFVAPWKNFSTWINQRCWEEAPEEVDQKKVFHTVHNSQNDLMYSDEELAQMGIAK